MTDEPRRGPGRPRTGRGVDGARVEVRLTPAEHDRVAAAAAIRGESAAAYLRRAGLVAAHEDGLTLREADAAAARR